MKSRKTRAGMAIALSCSLALGTANAAPAHAQIDHSKVAEVVTRYAQPRVDLSNPIYIDGQHVVILGNRYSLVEAGALAAQVAIGGAVVIAALVSSARACGSSEVSAAELSSCLGEDLDIIPATVKTSPEYAKGTPLSGRGVRKDDMEGFGPYSLGGKTYNDSLVTTGHFSGWGTRYFAFDGSDVDGFGAVVGIQDQGNGRSGPLPAKATLVFRVDGKSVESVEIQAGKPQYVEHKFTEGGSKVEVEIVGMEANGSRMNAHGGLVIGTPRVW